MASKPAPFTSLSSLLDARLLKAISSLGFTHPTAVQNEVLPLALQGKDILAQSRTGTGKTLAYGIPAVQVILNKKSALKKTDVDFHATRCLVLVPTRELSEQVAVHLRSLCSALGKEEICRVVNISTGDSSSSKRAKNDRVQKLQLSDKPDIVIATPSRALAHLRTETLNLSQLACLVIDEADLILSLGHSADDIKSLLNGPWSLPTSHQSFLLSATMTEDVQELESLVLKSPEKIILADEEDAYANLSQFAVRTNEEDKFLLLYVLLKLKLIKGKILIFVNDVDRGYRVKLFLEKFGIKSGVLNAELPFNSRYHAVLEFNRGVFDYLIATDDTSADTSQSQPAAETSQLISTQPTDEAPTAATVDRPLKRKRKAAPKNEEGQEYGVSRGIDFVDVSCVLNFDLPATPKAYTHRIGRTARAGRSGMSLSFIVPKAEWGKHKQGDISLPNAKHDERVWRKIENDQAGKGGVKEYNFDMKQVNAFRYRMEDGLRAVTRASVREARIKEIKHEVVNSERLKAHFVENPKDLAFLRHDKPLHASRVQPHLKSVPSYLVPRTTAAPAAESNEKQATNTRQVSFHKPGRGGRGGRGGSRGGRGRGGKKVDPLKTFASKR